ncbi:hypothetical protein CROQUDRAFT_502941 [Cronartium quercuum f. sp. fusiforme G11]|uniref:Alcohol dehydrogenase-like N-terminal domain-containing protein n=1 Tax=Cronartium quercuum f. sp. fusiforme G11 TaxID=708437 RepID=A0A9P6NY15_9BASI|nr:hypothetical protein CROQUDRAFT_502941 [Cronartium quercuum f. sp. fusiforme G11]
MDVSLLSAHKSYHESEPSPRSIQNVTFLNPKRNSQSAQSIATNSKRWSQRERSAVTVDSNLSTLSETRVMVNPNRFNDLSSCTRDRRVRQKKVQEEEERLGVVDLSEIVARMGYSPEEVESLESNFEPSTNLKSKELDLQPLTVHHTEFFPAINNTTSSTADSLMTSIDKPFDLRNQSSTYSRNRNRTSVYSLPPTRSVTANAFQNYPRRRMTGMSNVHASWSGQGQKKIHPYRSLPTLVIPSGGFEPNANPSKISRQLFETRTHSWNPTMYALSLVAPIRSNVPIASQLKYGNSISSPNQLGTGQILIEIHSVALDAWDLSILHTNLKNYENSKKSNHLNQNPFIPGRSFVGKVLDFGVAVKRLRRGDIVYGLQDIKKCGALAQQMVIDKDLVALAPVHSGLTIEQLACLPALGVPAHLVMSTICAGLPKGSKILILNGHKGLGAMMCDLVRYFRPGGDLWVTCHIPTAATSLEELGIATGRCEARGAREVIVEESVLQALNSIHESSYDIVIDTIGGRRIYDASRRILHHEGMFISCVGDKLRMEKLKDKVKMNMRSLRRTFIKKDQKKIGYWCLSPETDFDGQRQTIRDSLDEIRKLVEDSNHHYQHQFSLNLNEDPFEFFGRPVTSYSSLSNSIGIEPVIGAIYSFEESVKAFSKFDRLKVWNQRMIIQEPIDDHDDQLDLITGSIVVINIKKCPEKDLKKKK